MYYVTYLFATSNIDIIRNYHKLGGLKATETFCLIVERFCKQGHALSEGCREESFLAFF
jgi:hypothetical protein